ncbi:MAG: AEC family transporter [Porcipelethomonas sp.]
MTLTLLNQAAIMLILICLGILCCKTGIISEKGSKELSRLALLVINPVVIFMAYQKEFEARLMKGFLTALILGVVSFIIAAAAAYIAVRKKDGREADIERFSCIYSNCSFMGIPLIQALLGSEGVFYLTAYLTIFNILVWTHGVIMMSGQKSIKNVAKAFTSSSVIAIALGFVFFITGFRLPEILNSTLSMVGSMNTPVAMLVAGATIARTNVLKALKNPRIYYVMVLKLLLIPAITAVIFAFIPVNSVVATSVIIAAAAPSATMCTMFSLRYDRNSLYASEIFAVTTLLSVATMPLIVSVYQKLSQQLS